MIRVDVANRQRVLRVNTQRIKRRARRILLEMGFSKAELGVVFTDDEAMRQLNAHYRRRDEPTDVLAFAMTEGLFSNVSPHVLGDVVISAETARDRARRRDDIAQEIDRLLIHGVLHLIGYDHERSATAARVMRAKERRLRTILTTID